MAKGRITKRAVDGFNCPPGKDREILWDDLLAGFGVCAFPSGRKVYIAQTRKGGRSRRVALGQHGPLTPEQARGKALKALGDLGQGEDPVEARRAARRARTFANIAADFLSLHCATKRKARTKAEYDRLLEARILPAIGSKRLADIRKADVAKLHGDMAEAPYQANRALAIISAVWNYASRRGEAEAAVNPAKGLERYPEEGRERFLTAAELARLGETLRQGETVGLPYEVDEAKPGSKHAPKADKRFVRLDPFAVAAIRLLVLTGARLREILDARWEQLDVERGILFLPDSKTGRKPVYLGAAALELLASLPRVEGNPHLIPGTKPGAARADLNAPWAAVRKAAKLEGVRIHDLRHSFASVGAGGGMGLPVIGKLLGHRQAATTARYAHVDADPLRQAAEAIGAKLSSALDGRSGQIVPLRPSGRVGEQK